MGTGDISISGGTLKSSIAAVTVSAGKAGMSSGGLDLNGTSVGTLTLGSAKNFVMNGGTWTVSLGASNASDQIKGSGVGTFNISAGTITLDNSIIAGTFNLFSGFDIANSSTSVTVNGYDTNLYIASIDNKGVLTVASFADIFYTANGSTLGGNGSWTPTGGTNWSPSSTNVAGAAYNGTKFVNFSGTAGNVVVDQAGVTASKGINFLVSGYSISGGAITLDGTLAQNAINTGVSGTTTIASDINAANGLTKAGPGTLVLSGTTTATGGTTVAAGGLQIGAGGTTGTISGNIGLAGSTSLTFNRSDATSYAGNIAGTGTVSSIGGDVELSGNLSGTVAVSNSGSRTVTLSGTNTGNAGAINFSGGTLAFSAAANLGTSAVALSNSGTLSFTGTSASLTNAVSIGTGGGSVSVANNGALTLNTFTYGGAFTKTGAGSLTLVPSFNPGANALTVSDGSLILGQAAATTINIAASAALSSSSSALTVLNANRLNVNSGGSITGSGKLQFAATGSTLSNLSGNAGGSITAPIVLNSSNIAFTGGTWSGTTYTPGSFITYIGGTKGADTSTTGGLTISGGISGSASVDVSNGSGGGGGGVLVLDTTGSTYTGNTTINAATPDVANTANIKLGVNNALPTTTGIIVGTNSGLGLAVLNMNGFNQQVAYLADGASVSGSKYLTFLNNGANDSVLTLSGNTTPGTSTFGGVIADGSKKISVVKDGSYAQTLSGTNTFTGGLTIKAGELKMASAGAIGTTNALNVTGGTLTMNGNSATVSDLNGSAGSVIQNNHATAASVLTVSKASGASTFTGTLQDGAAGKLGLTKTGNGELAIGGLTTNTYSGPTSISGGTLRASKDSALGTSAVGMSGGSLYGAASTTIANTITIGTAAANGTSFGSTATLAGWDFNGLSAYGSSPQVANTVATGLSVVGLTRGSGVLTAATAASNAWGASDWSSDSTAAGAISTNDVATFSITVGNNSVLNIGGISAYQIRRTTGGPTTGQWQYQIGSNAFANIGSPITWGTAGSGGSNQTAIDLTGVNSLQNLASGTVVTFRVANYGATSTGNQATWYLNQFQTGDDFIVNGQVGTIVNNPASGTGTVGIDTAGTTTFTGGVTVNNTATFTAASGGTANFSGSIDGAGSITKTLGGVVTLSNISNGYTGTTTVNDGTLLINGTLNSGGGTVTVNTGGTLGGSGVVHRLVDVKSSGTLSPGNSTAVFTLDKVVLESNSNLAIQLNGTTVGTQYDQVAVTDGTDGNVSLNGSNLILSLTFDSQIGDSFTIINNDLNDAVIGTFVTGSLVSAIYNGQTYDFAISYTGGTGNDVVLTTLTPEPTSLALLAVGGGLMMRRRRAKKSA